MRCRQNACWASDWERLELDGCAAATMSRSSWSLAELLGVAVIIPVAQDTSMMST